MATQDSQRITAGEPSSAVVQQDDAIEMVPLGLVPTQEDFPQLPESEKSSEAPPTTWKAGPRQWAVRGCLALLSFVVSLDATIVIPALPQMAQGLKGDAVDTFWTGTSYLLTCAVFQPFIVSLSDIFGRPQLLLFSVVIFTIGTAVACTAKNFTELFAGRSVQGVGGGGITALAIVIFTDIIPLRWRPTYYGVIQAAWAAGTMTGPLFGGLFADRSTWRWVFYINFPFCLIGVVIVPFVIRLHVERGSLRDRILHTVDWVGAFLFIGSTTSLLIGTSWGGQNYAWGSTQTIIPIVVGLIGIMTTLYWEFVGTKTPFMRPWLFKDISSVLAFGCSMLQGLLMFLNLYSCFFHLQACRGVSATIAGCGIMVLTFSLLSSSIICGLLITRTARYRWALWLGWFSILCASALMIVLKASTPTWGVILTFIPLGAAHGLVLSSQNFAIQALAKARDEAYAAGFYTFCRTTGFCFGVAILGATFHNFLGTHLRAANLDVAIADNAEKYIILLNKVMKGSPLEIPLRNAYAAAFRNVFEVSTGIAGLAWFLSLFIREASMNRALESEHVLLTAGPQTTADA